MSSRRIRCFGALVVLIVAIGGFWLHYGLYGFSVIARRGGTVWTEIRKDDSRLTADLRAALSANADQAVPGPIEWHNLQSGFSVAESPILLNGSEVDTILLTRFDPLIFRLSVHSAPSGTKEVADWQSELGALAVINGSYFDQAGYPDTPTRMDSRWYGPTDYKATQGAVVINDRGSSIINLKDRDWKEALSQATYGFVSYPLLVTDGQSAKLKSNAAWLANRSFIGETWDGQIILGTTKGAFFTLERLAGFLAQAPLGLKIALNLDGGPVACQKVDIAEYHRDQCGQTETQDAGANLSVWTPLVGTRRAALPVALAVHPRQAP